MLERNKNDQYQDTGNIARKTERRKLEQKHNTYNKTDQPSIIQGKVVRIMTYTP